MKFQLVINMERQSADADMQEVIRHQLEMVQIADEAGFSIVWAAEHHGLELTIAPDPFQLLTWYAAHTNRIRLGTAVAIAPYWHPLKLAGEAAMCDLLSGGRLEFGIGSGAYQREFDRMMPGLKQSEGWKYMREMLPAVKALWEGDYEHNGEYWQFPVTTSVPKPLQKPHPPIWVAARAPITYDFAAEHGCNITSWALTRPFSEVEAYIERLNDSMAKFPGRKRPIFANMRHTAVCENDGQVDSALDAVITQLGRFENLFKNLGDVEQGFPKQIDLATLNSREEFDRKSLQQNLMIGTPDEIIAKLKPYETAGVDEFIYNATFGLDPKEQKRSLELFVKEVMPAFVDGDQQAALAG